MGRMPTQFRPKAPVEIYIRQCYVEMEQLLQKFVSDADRSATVVTGVPGIGKSLFLVYFLVCRVVNGLEIFWVQTVQNVLTLFERTDRASTSASNGVRATFRATPYDMGAETGSIANDLLLVDMTDALHPSMHAKHTIVFSSPNPLRYKELLKLKHHKLLTMPTWDGVELNAIGANNEIAARFGPAPRLIFDNDREGVLTRAVNAKAALVAPHVFVSGFGGQD